MNARERRRAIMAVLEGAKGPVSGSALAREVGPLAVTSANTHGMPAPAASDDIERRIAEAADLTLAAGPTPAGEASTIVDVTSAEPRIVRQGAIPADVIEALAQA